MWKADRMNEEAKAPMDRNRFEHLLSAYGGDLRRWPAAERAAAEEFLAQHGASVAAELAEARALDSALETARGAARADGSLETRVLASAPRPVRTSTSAHTYWALAACALMGVLLGYGGGQLATPASNGEDYFAMAFESPFAAPGDDG
jgi:hypothetical protein